MATLPIPRPHPHPTRSRSRPHARAAGLQGEHGTGRNVAAFVEMEWGSKAYELMWELKGMFDPGMVLNPGEAGLAAPCC